jgi:hypothetical protein
MAEDSSKVLSGNQFWKGHYGRTQSEGRTTLYGGRGRRRSRRSGRRGCKAERISRGVERCCQGTHHVSYPSLVLKKEAGKTLSKTATERWRRPAEILVTVRYEAYEKSCRRYFALVFSSFASFPSFPCGDEATVNI